MIGQKNNMEDLYIDKIELFPRERRADVMYRKTEDSIWPKSSSKYEILLLRILSYEITEWTFGKPGSRERSVIVEW